MTSKLQHYLNPLHVYCRLRDFGLPKGTASFLGWLYECLIFRWLILRSNKKKDRYEREQVAF
jgi:hypothetical protein